MKDKAQIHPRKLEIVEAAVACFLEQGYHQTGIRDIAKRAGISLGNLYNHFKGKEAVLSYIAEAERKELETFTRMLCNDQQDPLTRLRRFIVAYADYAGRPENALLGIEFLSEALRNAHIAEVFERGRCDLIEALSHCFAAGRKARLFAAVGKDREIACMILDMIDGYGVRTVLEPKQTGKSARALEKFILRALQA